MQPPTEPITTATTAALRGDETRLYPRHHQSLLRVVAHHVIAPRALIEDACQNAWTILLRRQPDRETVFGWLCRVAIQEGYRLSQTERRHAHLEELSDADGWDALIAAHVTIDDQLEARSALRALADLPERQRQDVALLIAGFTYREIAELTGVAPSPTSTST